MSEKYLSAGRKIRWAKKHIRDLETLTAVIPKDSYTLSIEPHPQTGQHSVKFQGKPLPPEFGLTFGDAVTNLRSALDHAFAAALGEHDARSGQIFFPIRDNRQGLIGSLQKRAKKKPIPKGLFDLIVDDIRPYEDGGHQAICALNNLANIDKHRLLIAITGIHGVTVSYTHGPVTIDNCFFGAPAGHNFTLSTGPGAVQFKSEPKPSLQIRIGEREPRIFHNKSVVPTLFTLADDVTVIIGKIEGVCP